MCIYRNSYQIQNCREGIINGFLSRCGHVLVSLLFHEVTSLHPPSYERYDFSTCCTSFFDLGQSPNKNEMHGDMAMYC